ncbi:MAG: hypothetical protein AB7P07_14385 [Hyphomonadaceae bacterium]
MANVDIETPSDFLAAHPNFPALLANDVIAARFRAQEAHANPAKRAYTALGQFSLLAAFATFTAVIFAVTLEPYFFPTPKIAPISEDPMFRSVMAIIGASGVAAQIYLLCGPLKKGWLNARFQTERLRSIKFQAFAEAARGGDEAVAAFTQRALSDFDVELSDSNAARHSFDPAAGMAARLSGANLASPHLAELKDAYRRLRIERQATFALGRIKAINEERRLPAASSEISFWGGAAIAYVDAILAFLEIEAAWLRPTLHFATLELFVLSALLFVLERGRAYTHALERYEEYREHMLRLGERLERAKTTEDFITCVDATESQALRELKSFCREAEKSTYLI